MKPVREYKIGEAVKVNFDHLRGKKFFIKGCWLNGNGRKGYDLENEETACFAVHDTDIDPWENDSLTLLKSAYILLLTIPDNEIRAKNQAVYVQIRDAIAEAENVTGRVIQERYESLALQIKNYPESIIKP
jgi:hypothetical protein